MTTPTDQFVDIANRSQEAVTTAVHNWADTVQSFASKLTAGQSQLPDPHTVVDQYFDFAEKVLASQREFAQQWASATLKATEAVTEQAQRATQSVTAHTAHGRRVVTYGRGMVRHPEPVDSARPCSPAGAPGGRR